MMVSCKRDVDDIPPIIYAAQFHAGSVMYMEDFLVSVQVEDEMRLTEITVTIVDESGQEQLPTITYSPTDKQDVTASMIAMNSAFMDSGNYYVRVSASDGENSSMRFFIFSYIGATRQLKHIWGIRGTGDTRTIDTLSSGQWQTVAAPAGRWTDISHWPRHTQGSLMSHERAGTFPWFDTDQMTTRTLPDSITTEEMDNATGVHYWGLRNGDLYITENGDVRLYYAADAMPVMDIAVGNDYIFVLKGDANQTTRNVLALHKSTGYLYHFASLDWPALGLIARSDEEVYVIGNLNNVGHIERFINSTSSIVPVWQSFQPSTVRSVWPGDDQQFYVVQADGVVRYTMDLLDYHVGMAGDALSVDWENIQQQLYIRTPGGLLLCDADANYLSTLSAEPLSDLFLEYNK
jgi:hypothetical protein